MITGSMDIDNLVRSSMVTRVSLSSLDAFACVYKVLTCDMLVPTNTSCSFLVQDDAPKKEDDSEASVIVRSENLRSRVSPVSAGTM